jgi:HAE1 family hydrophobic/amphiphilic exporter-1
MLLSDVALKRPIATSTLVFGLLIIGLFTLNRIGIDFLPRIDFPFITVATVYPGAGPQEIETLISKKIEDAVSEVDSIKYVRSVSMDNVSQVFIEFELGTNVDFAAIDVREKIDLVKSDLPDDAEDPVILKVDVNAKPVMNLVLYGDPPIGRLYDIADLRLRDQLSQIPGMASVDIIGGKKREIQVLTDGRRLAAYGLSILHLIRALGRENLDLPSGHITESRSEYTIRFEGEFDRIKDIEAVEIPIRDGRTVKLTDLAVIKDDFEEQRIIARYNGRECVTLRLKKRSDANTVAVVDGINTRLDDLRRILPKGAKLDVANDDSAFVRYSVSDVKDNMIIGIVLTIIILYLFLHNLRATLVAAVAIPISIIATLIPIYFAGFTLNMMSLMALAISVGVLVMNALVVLENIHRHLDKGETPLKAASAGTGEIGLAVTGSALTNIVVFLPIAFMSGIVGQFFFQFGVTVVFATVISLLVSFTVTPILASKLLKPNAVKKTSKGPLALFFRAWDKLYGILEKTYKFLMTKSLRWRWLVILIALISFLATTRLASHIGSEMITESDRAQATITVEMPPGTNISETEKTVAAIETIVRRLPEVNATLATVGKIEGMFGKSTEGVHVAEIMVLLNAKSERDKNIKDMLKELRQLLVRIPAEQIMVLQPSAIGGVEAPVQLEITGDDLAQLEKIAAKVLAITHATPGTVDTDTTWRSGKPEIRIFPDRKKLAAHGVDIATFAMVMRTYIEGAVASQFRERDEEYDIRVKLRDSERQSADMVENLFIPLPGGGVAPVAHFARIVHAEGPTQILRKDKQRLITVSTSAKNRSTGEIAKEIDGEIAKITIPPGYRIHQGGRVENMKEAFADIFTAFGLAIILTYLVLAALLESYIQPFTIMLTVPLSLIGVLIGLYLTGETFNIFSLMAVVMLVGIVVNNAILIIDYTLVLKNRGQSRNDALTQASVARLRPILMTTLAASFAMLPLALAWGWGAEMRSSMAVASIGGLLSSAVLTLFVVPVMYTYLDDLSGLTARIIGRFSPR